MDGKRGLFIRLLIRKNFSWTLNPIFKILNPRTI